MNKINQLTLEFLNFCKDTLREESFLQENVGNLKIYDTKLSQNNYSGLVFVSVLLTFDYIVEPVIEGPPLE